MSSLLLALTRHGRGRLGGAGSSVRTGDDSGRRPRAREADRADPPRSVPQRLAPALRIRGERARAARARPVAERAARRDAPADRAARPAQRAHRHLSRRSRPHARAPLLSAAPLPVLGRHVRRRRAGQGLVRSRLVAIEGPRSTACSSSSGLSRPATTPRTSSGSHRTTCSPPRFSPGSESPLTPVPRGSRWSSRTVAAQMSR